MLREESNRAVEVLLRERQPSVRVFPRLGLELQMPSCIRREIRFRVDAEEHAVTAFFRQIIQPLPQEFLSDYRICRCTFLTCGDQRDLAAPKIAEIGVGTKYLALVSPVDACLRPSGYSPGAFHRIPVKVGSCPSGTPTPLGGDAAQRRISAVHNGGWRDKTSAFTFSPGRGAPASTLPHPNSTPATCPPGRRCAARHPRHHRARMLSVRRCRSPHAHAR